MNKFEQLEKIDKLRKSGAINEEEFEKEKKKILAESEPMYSKGNKKISILFFILSAVLLIVTISFIGWSFYWYEKLDDMSFDYYNAKSRYEDYKEERYRYRALYEDAKEEYKELEEEYNELSKKYHFFEYGRYVTGVLCIASLGVGIIFIERKNKKEV